MMNVLQVQSIEKDLKIQKSEVVSSSVESRIQEFDWWFIKYCTSALCFLVSYLFNESLDKLTFFLNYLVCIKYFIKWFF